MVRLRNLYSASRLGYHSPQPQVPTVISSRSWPHTGQRPSRSSAASSCASSGANFRLFLVTLSSLSLTKITVVPEHRGHSPRFRLHSPAALLWSPSSSPCVAPFYSERSSTGWVHSSVSFTAKNDCDHS